MSHAESRRAAEVLRQMWSPHVSKTLRRAIVGFDRVQQAEFLFALVREHEKGSDEAWLLVAGQETFEDFLRSLRLRAGTPSPPRRSKHREQRADEHPNALQALPQLLAHGSEVEWAGGGWEDAVPRVTNGVSARVDRLRALGNAVVPQIPEMIARAIITKS